MSLRPAQALVAESSKFSLRTLFETAAPAEPPAAAVATMPLPLPFPAPSSSPSGGGAPVSSSPPLPSLSTLPKIATKEHSKFTFNGLVMPSSAHNASSPTGVGGGLPAAAVASALASGNADLVASENLRLKAATHTLQEKVAQLTQHLATTSESVMRGNKALVAERSQFHAQYSTLQDKLKETQAALIEAEAVPKEAMKNEKLLNAKLLELQTENDRLGAAADDSKLRAELNAAVDRHRTLAAQHSVLLEKHLALTADHEQMRTMLDASQAETSAALARIDTLQTEAAAADSLVDTLDAKLASARAALPTDGCGCSGGGADPKNTMDADGRYPHYDPNADVRVHGDSGPRLERTHTNQEMYAQQREAQEEEKEEEKTDAPAPPRTFKPTPEAVDETLEQMFGSAPEGASAAEATGTCGGGHADPSAIELPKMTRTYDDRFPRVEVEDLFKEGEEPKKDEEEEKKDDEPQQAAPTAAACCPATMRCEALQKAANEARYLADTCCEHDAATAKAQHIHREAVAKRAWASLASGKPEAAIAVHIHTNPMHVDEVPISLAAHIPPVSLQKGAKYEGGGVLSCDVPCCETGTEYPNTTEGRTNAFIEAVSRDMKVSMDGSQAAYQNSAKTGTAVRV